MILQNEKGENIPCGITYANSKRWVFYADDADRYKEEFGEKNWDTILEGNVVKRIVENAGDDSIIMLGVSPKNPITKYFFGSNPISITAQCNCPVLVAK